MTALSVFCRAYQDELTRTNSVDFDDLLNLGHELFEKNPHIVARIQSVLVDEVRLLTFASFPVAQADPPVRDPVPGYECHAVRDRQIHREALWIDDRRW